MSWVRPCAGGLVVQHAIGALPMGHEPFRSEVAGVVPFGLRFFRVHE